MQTVKKQYVILLVILLAVVFFLGVKYGEFNKKIPAGIVFSADDAVGSVSSVRDADIYVDLKGAVEVPGVYVLKQGQRVNDLLSGVTLLPEADLSSVNLAQFLVDAQVLYIPFKETPADSSVSSGGTPFNDDALNGKININTAGVDELDDLPGIGAAKAGAIVNYRNEFGSFAAIEEIVNVPGIGEGIFDQIKDLIRAQ